MFSDNLVLHVTNQTNLYTVQHGKGNLNNLEDEIRTFIAVLLLSGYCKVLYGNLYWASAPDTHIEAVSCAINRYRFWEILLKLHLAYNRLQKKDTKYEDYLKSWISVSNSMIHLLNTVLMRALSFTMENMTQNSLLEENPLGLSLNFGASHHLKGIPFMQNHIVE